MKQTIAAMAVVMALTSGTAGAQDGILGRIGKGLMQAGKDAASAPATKRYLEPAGTYWDDGDPEVLDGYTRVRWGLAATASGGFDLCEGNLLAQVKAGYAMTPSTRTRCTGSWQHLYQRLGQAGDPAAAFEAKARQFAATDRFYLRPPMDVEIDPKTGILHAYAKIFDNAWYPHSPGFLPTAVVGASPLGRRSAVVGVEHGGRYHAALRLKPEDVAELNRVGLDVTGDRIFFRVLKGGLQPNGLPDIVLRIDRMEIGYKNQVIGITPSKDKDA